MKLETCPDCGLVINLDALERLEYPAKVERGQLGDYGDFIHFFCPACNKEVQP